MNILNWPPARHTNSFAGGFNILLDRLGDSGALYVEFQNVLISAQGLHFDEKRPREQLDYGKQAE